jgi:hypothetical protein
MVSRVVALELPLALDTLARAMTLGLRGCRPQRPALLFSIFEGIMPLFGIAVAPVETRHSATAVVLTRGIVSISTGIRAMATPNTTTALDSKC